MSALRAHLDAEEVRIEALLAPLREQERDIDAQLREVRRALHAVQAPEERAQQRQQRVRHGSHTIQDMIATILADFPYGTTAQRIVQEIGVVFNRDVTRESLAPQLSRMAHAGELRHEGKLWIANAQPVTN